jgi:phosphatidylglycerol:prolipoprotein diacylglycerol transferase
MHPLIPFWERIAIPIGPLTVHGFGILVALGFVLGAKMARNKAAKDGFDPEVINRLVGWLVLGVFLGGHLGHLFFYYPEDMANDGARFGLMFSAFASGRLPTGDEIPEVLQVWQGLSSFGGFIACTLLAIWFFKREKVRLWPYADAVAFGLMTGWMFGRLGCFAAHDHPGTETRFWLGATGICPDAYGSPSVACHDLGLYEAMWSGAMALWFWFRNKIPRHPGYYVGWMCLSYGPSRLIMDIYRHPDGDTRYFGFTPAQYGSIALALVGAYILWSQRKKTPIKGDWKPEVVEKAS